VSNFNRLVLLTNFVAPYRTALFEELDRRCREFRILVIAPVEPSRSWSVDWRELPVQQQRSISIRTVWHHQQGFTEPLTIHVPYDTLSQLVRFCPDVVIADELGARTLQAAVYRAIGRRTRLVVWAKLSEVTEQGRGSLRLFLRRILLKLADAVIVNGGSGSRYVKNLGVKADKVFRIPQTTDVACFLAIPPERSPAVRHRLLYCGRLVQLKGLVPFLTNLAEFARQRPNQQIEVWFAGDGPLRSDLAQFALPANLDLTFLGDVPYDRLPEVYSQAGILVFPTLADEWGLVVVEAMAAGLPVLGSLHSQAVEDLVTDGLDGWSFRPDDCASLQSALNRALGAPPEEIDRMGQHARNRVRDLTPESMSQQIMAALEYAYAQNS